MSKITVEYPTKQVTIIPKTANQIMREKIAFRTAEVMDHYRIVTEVNQSEKIYVNKVKNVIDDIFKSNEDRSLEQTSMNSSSYQAKFNQAWNE